jgi:hypothetical protein
MRFKDKWQRHSIAISSGRKPMVRSFERHTRNTDGDIIRVQVEEVVHANDVYRKKIEGRKKPDRTLWHRGARVGSV